MTQDILLFALFGFIAQIIDGSLGMAYGVSASTLLLSIGIHPAAASASVHTAEIFTTAVSGFSHWRFGNIDKALFKRLVIPGIIGGIVGAYILTTLPTSIIKPIVSFYLLLMGVRILLKAFRKLTGDHRKTHLGLLGFTGGAFDAIGGGGWGPIVTTTLIANGGNPRKTIGSVNLVEFFVTVAESVTFILTIGLIHWEVIIGLMVGGVIAAPFGAYLTSKISARSLMIIVGVLIILLSLRTIVLSLN